VRGVRVGSSGGSDYKLSDASVGEGCGVSLCGVRTMIIGTMFICVPCHSERRAFARGLFFYDEVVNILQVIVRAVFSFSYPNFTNREVSSVS
jgi:hypothetical protein